MENTQNDLLSNIDLEIDNPVRQQLYESAKWSRFIAIVMFIAAGLILIAGLAGGAALSGTFRRIGGSYQLFDELTGPLLIILFVVFAGLIVLVYYFLYAFSAKIKNALVAENKQELNAGLKSLKIFFIITTAIAALSLLNTTINLFK